MPLLRQCHNPMQPPLGQPVHWSNPLKEISSWTQQLSQYSPVLKYCFSMKRFVYQKNHFFLKITGGSAQSLVGFAQPNHALPWLLHYERITLFLFINGIIVILREGFSFSHSLSLILSLIMFTLPIGLVLFIISNMHNGRINILLCALTLIFYFISTLTNFSLS